MRNKLIMSMFAVALVFIALPAMVFADDNDTNTTGNVTANITENITSNVTANVTSNTTVNTTTNTTNSSNDDDEDDDEQEVDMHDVALGNTNHGMEVRLLQLFKSLERNTEHGKIILDEIHRQNMSVNTHGLENLLDDANDLKKEISDKLAIEPVNVSTEDFVAYKSEAINLSAQFRKELSNVLTPEQLNSIKAGVRDKLEKNDKNSVKLNAIKTRISQKAKEHNIEQALKMYNKFELNNTALKAKIESGNFTAKELRSELIDAFHAMKKAQKKNAQEKIREEQEKLHEAKAKMNGKNMKLNNEEVMNIVKDDSLTWEEKETKMRVLAQERKENRNSGKANLNKSEDGSDTEGDNDGRAKGRESGRGPRGE